MYTYSEIKEFILNFNQEKPSYEDQEKLKEIATQLHFTYKDCGCKALWIELHKKLSVWLKNHTELCHYTMPTGMILWTADKELVSATNITDTLAEKIIAEGTYADRIIRILPEITNEEEQVVTAEEITDLETKSEEVKTKKTGKRTIKKQTK